MRPDPPPEHRWKPGQSGNPAGKPKYRLSMSARLRRQLVQACKDGDGQQADAVARALIDRALTGDVQAIRTVFERIDDVAALKRLERLELEADGPANPHPGPVGPGPSDPPAVPPA